MRLFAKFYSTFEENDYVRKLRPCDIPGAGPLMHFNLFDCQNTPTGRILLPKFFHSYRFINHLFLFIC